VTNVSSKARQNTHPARTTNGKKRGVPPPSRNGESSQSAAAGISIEKDFYAWLVSQTQAIREHRLDALDWESIAEELDGMARSEKHALTSHLRVMLTHLLKWAYQSKERELHLSSWRGSIVAARQEIDDALEESPSLGSEQNLEAFLKKAYRQARQLAAVDMGLSDREMNRMFPTQCPWTFAQFMADGFLPEQQSAIASR
jgi:predicted DNA-binding ribbon-helix-helix protein